MTPSGCASWSGRTVSSSRSWRTRSSRTGRCESSRRETGEPAAATPSRAHAVVGGSICRSGGPAPSSVSTAPPSATSPPSDPDRDLRQRLRRFAKAHPRWGYRRAHAVLGREGWAVNRKKVQRLWREEGLRSTCRPTATAPAGSQLGSRTSQRRPTACWSHWVSSAQSSWATRSLPRSPASRPRRTRRAAS